MFSPAFTKFLIRYQIDEYESEPPEKECIYFSQASGELADVKIIVE